MSQVPTNEVLDFIPTLVKPHKAIHKLANGKALGFDEITAEVFKNGCLILARYNGDFQNISPGSLAPALVIFQAYVEGVVLVLGRFSFLLCCLQHLTTSAYEGGSVFKILRP